MDDSTKDLTSSERFLSRLYLSRAEPSRAEPSRAEPSRAEPSRAEPSRAEPSRAEPSRAERAEPPSRAEPSRAEPSRAEPSRAEPSRAEPSRAEPSRAEPSRAEPSRPSRASRAEPSRGTQCMSGLNHAAYGLPVNASRPGSPQAHASLGSGWRPTLAGWDWIPTGFRTRFRRSHHGILSPLTGLSRHTRWCTNRHGPARCSPTGSSPADAIRHWSAESGHPIEDLTAEDDFTPLPGWAPGAKTSSDDGRVAEERVLHPALTMAPRRLLPPSPSERVGGEFVRIREITRYSCRVSRGHPATR